MANSEHLNTAKFYSYNDKFIDSYDFDTDITDIDTICNIIKMAYEKNANIFISNQIYFTSFESIRKIVVNDKLTIHIY